MINKTIDYFANNYHIPREAVATILISVIIFLLGILINFSLSQINKYLQRRMHRTLAEINYRLLIINIYKQKDDYFLFIRQLVIEHKGSFLYTYRIMPALDVFNKLGYENLYRAYFKGVENFTLLKNKKKLSAFNNLWSSIEYLNHIQKDSIENVNNFIKKNSELNDLRNLSLGKAQDIVENFRIHFHRELTLKEPLGVFYGKREEIIKNYHKTKDYNLPKITEDYVQKLLNLNRDNVDVIQRYERDIHAVELNSYLLEASYRYENMKNHIDSVHHYFETIFKSYTERYESLKRNYSILNPSISKTLRKGLIKLRKPFKKRRRLS